MSEPSYVEPPLDFVIVGAQRAASTYLNACLRHHPEVFLCPDEVPFFEDPFFRSTPVLALRKVFAQAKAGQRRGIQRPDYLGREECAGHIHELVPDARIIAVLRDPVQRAVSAYFWYVQFGLLPLVELNEGIQRLLDGWRDPAFPRASEILTFGLYGQHLTRYISTFGFDRVLVLTSDQLREPTTFARTCTFLGVNPAQTMPISDRVQNAGVYDTRRLRVLRARRRFAWSWDNATEYTYRPRRLRRPMRFIPNAMVVGVDRLLLARVFGNRPPRLTPAVTAQLHAYYDDDITRLESLLSRDFTSWRRPVAQR